MTTNPYAYYDDKPLPVTVRPLSVSSDGEEEPDKEPRGPLELKGYFIALFRPAVRTYQINVMRDSFECRLPNDEYLQLSREDARKVVSVHGNEIDIVIPGTKAYCFRCSQINDLALARLKIWLHPPLTDPEEAYKAVAEQLTKRFGGNRFNVFILIYIIWLLVMVMWDRQIIEDNQQKLNNVFLFYSGLVFFRMMCFMLFSAFFLGQLFGLVNVGLFRVAALLSLLFPISCSIAILFPQLQIEIRPNFLFEIYFPVCFCVFSHRYRNSKKQLQRDNGLI